jgi:hypothetical protein
MIEIIPLKKCVIPTQAKRRDLRLSKISGSLKGQGFSPATTFLKVRSFSP